MNYNLKTSGWRKHINIVCHINTLNPYFERTNEGGINTVATLVMESNRNKPSITEPQFIIVGLWNSCWFISLKIKMYTENMTFERREKLKIFWIFFFNSVFR